MSAKHLLAALVLTCVPVAAFAQDDRGAHVSGAVSATAMDSATAFSFSGAFGYRFSRVVGFELEATMVPKLKTPFPGYTILAGLPDASTLIFPTPRFDNARGRLVIFSSNVRIAVPTTSARLEPYFVAGGGVASVRRTADYVYPVFPLILATMPPGQRTIVPPSELRWSANRVTDAAVDLALTLGGGLSVRVAAPLMVDVDLRLFRLLGREDQNVGRFGVGARYRF